MTTTVKRIDSTHLCNNWNVYVKLEPINREQRKMGEYELQQHLLNGEKQIQSHFG